VEERTATVGKRAWESDSWIVGEITCNIYPLLKWWSK
jgi:hypothetical protein